MGGLVTSAYLDDVLTKAASASSAATLTSPGSNWALYGPGLPTQESVMSHPTTESTPIPENMAGQTSSAPLFGVPLWPTSPVSQQPLSATPSETVSQTTNGEAAVCGSPALRPHAVTCLHASSLSPPPSTAVSYQTHPSLPPDGWRLPDSQSGVVWGASFSTEMPLSGGGLSLIPLSPSTLLLHTSSYTVSGWASGDVSGGWGSASDVEDGDDGDLMSGSSILATGDPQIMSSHTLPLQTLPDSSAAGQQSGSDLDRIHFSEWLRTSSSPNALPSSIPDPLQPSSTLPSDFALMVATDELAESFTRWHSGGQSAGGVSRRAGHVEPSLIRSSAWGSEAVSREAGSLLPPSLVASDFAIPPCSSVPGEPSACSARWDALHASLALLSPSAGLEPGGQAGSMSPSPGLSPCSSASLAVPPLLASAIAGALGDAGDAEGRSTRGPVDLPASADACISVAVVPASAQSPTPVLTWALPTDSLPPSSSASLESGSTPMEGQADSSASGSVVHPDSQEDVDQELEGGRVYEMATPTSPPSAPDPAVVPTGKGQDSDDRYSGRSSSFYFEAENEGSSSTGEMEEAEPRPRILGRGEEGSASGQGSSGSLYDNETSTDFSISEYSGRQSEDATEAGKACWPSTRGSRILAGRLAL